MMSIVRIWIPATILLAGIVLVIVRGADETSLEGGAALWGAGLSVALLNWLHRMGVTGDRAREDEDAARAYFERHRPQAASHDGGLPRRRGAQRRHSRARRRRGQDLAAAPPHRRVALRHAGGDVRPRDAVRDGLRHRPGDLGARQGLPAGADLDG